MNTVPKVTKQDAKAIKTLIYTAEKIRKDNNRDQGSPLTQEEMIRNNMAITHLRSKFGKYWPKVTREWLEIQAMKEANHGT
jgi:hypothetical protein